MSGLVFIFKRLRLCYNKKNQTFKKEFYIIRDVDKFEKFTQTRI